MLGNHELVGESSPYEGGFFKVMVDTIRLPDGHEALREYVLHPGASAVVAIRGGQALLVRQNRHAIGSDLLEIVAGKLDVAGETPEECAHRELEEETGYQAGSMEALGTFYSSPGFTNERFHLFLATELTRVAPAPETDAGEPISTEWLPLDQAVEAVVAGRITDGKTALGLVLATLRGAG